MFGCAFHRDALAGAVGEHPGDPIRQAARVAIVAVAPAGVCHSSSRRQRSTRGARRADAGIEQFVSTMDDRRQGAGNWQVSRLDGGQLVIGRRGPVDVHHGHIAADEIHHVSARVGRIQDNALGIEADLNAHYVAGIGHVERRVNGRLAVGVELHAHDLVNSRGDHEAFIAAALEGDGDGGGDEESCGHRLELNALVHVDGLVRLGSGDRVEDGEQTLQVDVKRKRSIRRGADVGKVGTVAPDDDALQQIGKGASDVGTRGASQRTLQY